MAMRRLGARWRDTTTTTPREVLDIFKVEGRYEVLLRNWRIDDPKDEWADGLDVGRDGSRYASFELQPYEARGYRQRNSRKRQSWASLPKAVRDCVTAWRLEVES